MLITVRYYLVSSNMIRPYQVVIRESGVALAGDIKLFSALYFLYEHKTTVESDFLNAE